MTRLAWDEILDNGMTKSFKKQTMNSLYFKKRRSLATHHVRKSGWSDSKSVDSVYHDNRGGGGGGGVASRENAWN